ncbi:MAG: sodium:proton antiporter [Candidatus Promineifilaceae bacterium]|nr:sodium:proton antiporter [Candidatus Promineifilaceae bacterium]
MHDQVLFIAGILALGIFCQWLAWRLNVPAILPLLGAGLLVGPALGVIHPQELLGDLFFPLVSLSVAVILFEGALTLQWDEVRNVVDTVRNLVSVGALITWIVGAVAAFLLVGMSWQLAVLFGALVVVTGPTVINPLLRNVRPTQRIASVLKWEGILIDPLGALLAVLVFDFIVAEGPSQSLGLNALTGFLEIVLIATGSGVLGGIFVAFLLRRYLVPDYLRDVVVLAVVAFVFAVSDFLSSESGLLAVTLMGLLLANLELPQLHNVLNFKEKLSVILISTLFIILGANLSPEQILALDLRSLAVLGVVMLIGRPLAVQASALGSQLTRNERVFLSWIAPRGIVAAAVSSLFAFRLADLGYADAPMLVSLTFLVIVGTVLIQGGTAKTVARFLGVAEAEPQGFLIMGAHAFARRLSLALVDEGFVVRLVDTNWHNVSEARLEGLEVFHGDILSESTDAELDLSGIGRLLALTSNYKANALACAHLQGTFGSSHVFQLPPRTLPERDGATPSRERLGRLLFHEEANYQNLEQMLEQGATIKKTKITETFSYDDYRSEHQGKFVPLMQLKGQRVKVVTVEEFEEPQESWTLVSLVAPSDDEESALIRSSADSPKQVGLLDAAL